MSRSSFSTSDIERLDALPPEAESFCDRLGGVIDSAMASLVGEASTVRDPAAAHRSTDAPARDSRDRMAGQMVGHHRIEERLGEGGMGVVYRSLDTRLQRIVALKFLSRHLRRSARTSSS